MLAFDFSKGVGNYGHLRDGVPCTCENAPLIIVVPKPQVVFRVNKYPSKVGFFGTLTTGARAALFAPFMPYNISITACLTVATTSNRCIFAFMQCAALATFICPIPMFKDGIGHDYRIRHVEINPSPQYPIPNNFFTKNCPCSVCGLRPPET